MKVTYGAIVQRASGRFGGTVHSNWKGVDVVRRFAKPSNPDTAGQQDVRNTFRNLSRSFVLQSATMREAWNSYVTGKPLINRNAWIKFNVAVLAPTGAPSNIVPTPGDSSTLPPSAFAPAGGAGQITSTITPPTAPTGWTISSCTMVAILDGSLWNGSPLEAPDLTWYEATDLSNPYQPTISGLDPGNYQTWAFISWEAPDGSGRYSASLAGGQVTVS